MGHARCYISFDIIRRVLSDYFKYNVNFVQNITDIDDKIIKRARQTHLWNEFIKNFNSQADLENEFKQAKEDYQSKIANELDESKKQMLIKQLDEANQLSDLTNLEEFKSKGRNVFIEYLDKIKGSTVTDNRIFTDLPRKFENDFYEDMRLLNVLRPVHAPRVSEYIDEIIKFIEKIIKNGFAYKSSSGSVYFNTSAFNSHQLHKYGKLAPEAIGDQQLLNEGEGDLSNTNDKQEKLNPKDFALWKASKSGEPSWSSEWSAGRPGWHIECSAMACNLLGDYADLHSGGIDLRFPHHENEIAQTESYFNTGKDWINCFLHTGHLHIEGCKMSKSLKNFISIKDALNANTSRQIRLAFLLHSWEDSLDYSKKTMQEALSYEKTFKEFFYLVEDQLLRNDRRDLEWTNLEKKLDDEFIKCAQTVDDCLCDNINTKGCLIALSNLINSVNIYCNDKKGIKIGINLIKQIGIYVTRLLKIFGVIENQGDDNSIGLVNSKSNSQSKKETILPYVKVISEFREKVREHAKEIKSSELLKLCDELRDIVLPVLAVKLDDKEIDGKLTTLIKIDEDDLVKSPEQLKREHEERIQLEKAKQLEKQLEKERKKQELARQQAAKDEEKKIPPNEFFTRQTDKYSKFDQDGFPTHDKDGKELSLSLKKKLKNLLDKHSKKYDEYMKSLNK